MFVTTFFLKMVVENPETKELIQVWKNYNDNNLIKNKHKDIIGRKDDTNYQLKENTENEFFFLDKNKNKIDVREHLNPKTSERIKQRLNDVKNLFTKQPTGGKRRTKRRRQRSNKKRTNKRKKTKTKMKKRKTHKRKTNKRRRKR